MVIETMDDIQPKTVDIELKCVKLSPKSRKSIRSWMNKNKTTALSNSIYGNVIIDIEFGNWFGTSPSYDFGDIKETWENGFRDFFDIPDSVLVEIDDFQTPILSFDRGVYPTKRKRKISNKKSKPNTKNKEDVCYE